MWLQLRRRVPQKGRTVDSQRLGLKSVACIVRDLLRALSAYYTKVVLE